MSTPRSDGARPVDVLVVGDVNPDLVLRGDVRPRFGQAEQLLDGADLVLGGSAGIVAAGIARLGLATSVAARVGTDRFGDAVLAQLAERSVGTELVGRDPVLPTGVSIVLSEPKDRAILTMAGAIPSLVPGQVTDEALHRVRHVHVASFFLQPELAAGLSSLFQRARQAGCTTSLDTNWDPARRWAGVREVLPVTDIFLPNTAELLAITGRPVSESVDPDTVRQAAAELHALGPVVAVKAGPAGASGVGPSGVETVPGPVVDVVDTTGAGDSFDAGFLAAWLRGLPLRECLRWAVVAGSLSTRDAGGTAAQADLAELMAAL